MSLDDLRAKFLALNAEQTIAFDVVTDRVLSQAVTDARALLTAATAAMDSLAEERQEALAGAHEDRSEPLRYADPAALANPVADIDERIAAAQDDIDRAEEGLAAATDAARAQTVTLIFGRLAPDAYAALADTHTSDKGDVNMGPFSAALAAACYRRAEDGAGTDLGIGWDAAREGALTDGDLLVLYTALIAHNREVTVHPR